MEKEQNSKTEENISKQKKSSESSENNKELKEKEVKLSPEAKIKEEGLKKKKMMPLNMEDFHLQENL